MPLAAALASAPTAAAQSKDARDIDSNPQSDAQLLTARGKPIAHWLDAKAPAVLDGATWGMPWPRGKVKAQTSFALRDGAGAGVPVQNWPIAYWPDGSL